MFKTLNESQRNFEQYYLLTVKPQVKCTKWVSFYNRNIKIYTNNVNYTHITYIILYAPQTFLQIALAVRDHHVRRFAVSSSYYNFIILFMRVIWHLCFQVYYHKFTLFFFCYSLYAHPLVPHLLTISFYSYYSERYFTARRLSVYVESFARLVKE